MEMIAFKGEDVGSTPTIAMWVIGVPTYRTENINQKRLQITFYSMWENLIGHIAQW